MTIPEPNPNAGPTWAAVAVAVLVVVLLLGAVAVVRSAPTGPTDVSAGWDASLGSDPDDPASTAPLDAGDFAHAGLVAERTDAQRAVIERAAVGEGQAEEPPPDAFGPTRWGCAELEHLLARDLSPVVYRTGSGACRVASGVLDDPYLGRAVRYDAARPGRVEVDRIVSLRYAWQHGAAGWTSAERLAFARDRRNLLVVDARPARAKAGRGPADWLPPAVALRCAYAARFAEVASAYDLTLTAADQEIARRQCAAPP